jgi:hypothetical protein
MLPAVHESKSTKALSFRITLAKLVRMASSCDLEYYSRFSGRYKRPIVAAFGVVP